MGHQEAGTIIPLIGFKPALTGMTFKVGVKVAYHG